VTAVDTAQLEADAQTVRPRSGRRVLTLSDLVLPAAVLVMLGALYLWLDGQELDGIEQNVLNQDSIVRLTTEHIQLSVTIAVLVILLAVPLGVLVTRPRTRRLAPLVVGLANVGQAAPSLGLLALVGLYYVGFWAVVFILTGYAALSVLRNTIVGLQQVDPGVLDAARGMGMSPLAVLFVVELPLAVPVIGAGARTALVLAVGTVPLGYALGAGGLGLALFGAIKTNRPVVTFTVAVLIAALALMLDWAAGIVQRMATPRGIR
jgi:osmoprotectant transport system permease protein